eukprot:CAMPEP_0119512702 /NCGR_PEP_ID=MMETSP1344-20130328/31013_1 /TAXON_ID=236787 /ORGANISM="Florenciella parvula, Strain CCMP2471" /LENGTH=34 /DNA_ID= /DNA_START= /DNA_END= /DNA_ORIENTATION=
MDAFVLKGGSSDAVPAKMRKHMATVFSATDASVP